MLSREMRLVLDMIFSTLLLWTSCTISASRISCSLPSLSLSRLHSARSIGKSLRSSATVENTLTFIVLSSLVNNVANSFDNLLKSRVIFPVSWKLH